MDARRPSADDAPIRRINTLIPRPPLIYPNNYDRQNISEDVRGDVKTRLRRYFTEFGACHVSCPSSLLFACLFLGGVDHMPPVLILIPFK